MMMQKAKIKSAISSVAGDWIQYFLWNFYFKSELLSFLLYSKNTDYRFDSSFAERCFKINGRL